MAVNLAALSVVHPGVGASVENRLPHQSVVFRYQPATQTDTSDAAFGFGFGDAPVQAPSTLVGHFSCAYGPYRNRDGKQVTSADGVVITEPYQLTFFAQDGALLQAGDTVSVNERIFKVIVPPAPGSFDVLVSALCQFKI